MPGFKAWFFANIKLEQIEKSKDEKPNDSIYKEYFENGLSYKKGNIKDRKEDSLWEKYYALLVDFSLFLIADC